MSLRVWRKTAKKNQRCDFCDHECWAGDKMFCSLGNAWRFCSLDCARRGLTEAAKSMRARFAHLAAPFAVPSLWRLLSRKVA